MQVQGIKVEPPQNELLKTPGHFYFWRRNEAGQPCYIVFGCPCCGESITLPLKPAKTNGWGFDGNEDQPTLDPSIAIGEHGEKRKTWHGYLTAGVFQLDR